MTWLLATLHRWVPLNSRRIRVLPGGTKRDRTDTSSAGSNTASGESGAAPQQEERRTRTRTSVIMAQAAGLAAASGASGPGGPSGLEDLCGPEAERRRFGGINSAGMHVPVAANDPMVKIFATSVLGYHQIFSPFSCVLSNHFLDE